MRLDQLNILCLFSIVVLHLSDQLCLRAFVLVNIRIVLRHASGGIIYYQPHTPASNNPRAVPVDLAVMH